MGKKYLERQPKTSARIWAPILEKLTERMEASCLRRDAWLARVIEVELDHLDHEVPIPNSQASFDYVSSRLDSLGPRKLVSLVLPQPLIDRLNAICAAKRIVRDAFFNRLFLLLVAEPKVIDRLLFGGENWRKEVWSEYRNDGPFFQNGFDPLRPDIDPFWAMRTGLEIAARDAGVETAVDEGTGTPYTACRDAVGELVPVDAVYTVVFEGKVGGKSLVAFSTYLPDSRVPNTLKQRAHHAKLDELMANLI